MTLEKRLAEVEEELDEMKAQHADLKDSTSRALGDLMTQVSSLASTLATFESVITGKN